PPHHNPFPHHSILGWREPRGGCSGLRVARVPPLQAPLSAVKVRASLPALCRDAESARAPFQWSECGAESLSSSAPILPLPHPAPLFLPFVLFCPPRCCRQSTPYFLSSSRRLPPPSVRLSLLFCRHFFPSLRPLRHRPCVLR